MLSPAEFREIVSGRRRGLPASLWRGLFAAIEPVYTAAVRYRNWRFDTGRIDIARVERPVVSVGNLTLGGTGKTPMVEWLARWFGQQGLRVALISRGYGAAAGEQNDEALELRQKLGDVPHLLNPQRSLAAREAVAKHQAQVLVLDDGFQHRLLARDLDIVLLDAMEPYGFGRVFPRGMLREPLAGLARAHVVGLSRADAVDAATRQAVRERVRSINADALWLELAHAPRGWRNGAQQTRPLGELQGRPVLAFCGIGNPAGFRHVLESCGCQVVGFREFPDHHAYTSAEVQALGEAARQAGAEALVCTHKDLVKMGPSMAAAYPLWALEIGLQILSGEAELEERLRVLATLAGGPGMELPARS